MKAVLFIAFIALAACYDYKNLLGVNLLVKADKKTKIDNFNDALAHYRSGAGGVVPAAKLIDSELKKDKTYVSLIKNKKNEIKEELAKVDKDKTSGTITAPSSKTNYLSSMTLGSYGVVPAYSFKWSASAYKTVNGKTCRTVYTPAAVSMTLTGQDYWDFEPNTGYSGLKNLIREKIPGYIASWRANGKEQPFTITVSMTENMGKFSISQCK